MAHMAKPSKAVACIQHQAHKLQLSYVGSHLGCQPLPEITKWFPVVKHLKTEPPNY